MKLLWMFTLALLAGCTTNPLPAPSGGWYVGVCRSQYEGTFGDQSFVDEVEVEERVGPIFHCRVRVNSGETGTWQESRVVGVGPIGHIVWTR